MILPDVNLLIYAHDEDSHWHARAREWWSGLLNGREPVGIPWMVSVGFLRLITHPELSKDPCSPDQAAAILKVWFSTRHVRPLAPGRDHYRHFQTLFTSQSVTGNLINDAHIAAIALEHEACIHSNDTDFARFPGVQFHNPLAA